MSQPYDASEEIGIQIEYPKFIDAVEKQEFYTWTNGHFAGKDYLIAAEKRSVKGFIYRNNETGDVKFELQIEYINLNALDNAELVLESIRQL